MKVFHQYAKYYDILYEDKDYKKECDFLEKIFRKYSEKKVRAILDLGCGTGNHILLLAERGYSLIGVDISRSMLKIAKKKAKEKHLAVGFRRGDIRQIRLKRKFDAVISMFAVISYQTKNQDVEATFQTVAKHLQKGGLFGFDCWYGPAVLAQRPEKRSKIIQYGKEKVQRVAKPLFSPFHHLVQVQYTLYRLPTKSVIARENHLMRFFFPQELIYYLGEAGFQVLNISPFGKLKGIPAEKDWNIIVIAKKT